jgi:hypothetical protein
MRIHGIDGLSLSAIEHALKAGGRLVIYEFCISFVILSLRRPTGTYYVRPGERGVLPGLPFVLLSLLFGWWGLPWGLIYTPLTVITNLSGGRDVTAEVLALLHQSSPSATVRASPG